MKTSLCLLINTAILLLATFSSFSQKRTYNAIYSGVPWYDDRGEVVSAHGANIIKEGNRLTVSDSTISIPEYKEAWQINLQTGLIRTVTPGKKLIENKLSSDKKDTTITIPFTGTQAGLYGFARPDGGYARVTLLNSKQTIVYTAVIDMYCKYPVLTLKYVTPQLPKDRYILNVTVMGERGN